MIKDLTIFALKQINAALFGITMLALIVISKYTWQADWSLARYDFLFLAALCVQIIFLVFKLETPEEAKVIFLFHIVGTVMELFKTHVGSWVYPEDNFFRIEGVPLFSGFMYSCVGSYIARSTTLYKLKYKNYPPLWLTAVLCAAIYINFFSHHYIVDFRYILFAATVLIYRKTLVNFTPHTKTYSIPLAIVFISVGVLIWIAENIATFAGAWIYPHQPVWHMVSPAKIGAWFLLMIISFVLVTLVHKPNKN